MTTNPYNYINYGLKIIKRQTKAAYGCFVAGQSPWTRAKPTVCRLYSRSVCDTPALLQMQLRLWDCLRISFMPLSFLPSDSCAANDRMVIQKAIILNISFKTCQ